MSESKTCNQCHDQLMEMRTQGLRNVIYVCITPECANYALMQVPLEDMP